LLVTLLVFFQTYSQCRVNYIAVFEMITMWGLVTYWPYTIHS